MFPALIKKTDLVSLSIKFVLSLPHHTQKNFFFFFKSNSPLPVIPSLPNSNPLLFVLCLD